MSVRSGNSTVSSSTKLIPDFPGQPITKKRAPLPPKYLEVKTADGKIETVEIIPKLDDKGAVLSCEQKDIPDKTVQGSRVLQREKDRIMNEPLKLHAPVPGSIPLINAVGGTAAPKIYSEPPHKFGSRVNSKSDYKSTSTSDLSLKYPPAYVGSIAKYGELNKMPKAPTLPRPYVPPDAKEFANIPFTGNRAPSGHILGATRVRTIESERVPILAEEIPLGPDNPSKQLSEVWYAYWDDQAGAVYYYNHETGEATWVKPTL